MHGHVTSSVTALIGLGVLPASATAEPPRLWIQGGLSPVYRVTDEGPGISRAPLTGLIGVGISLAMSPNVAFETGLGFERRSQAWAEEWSGSGGSTGEGGFERRIDLDYLRLPLRLRIERPHAAVAPSAHIALEGGWLLRAYEIDRARRGRQTAYADRIEGEVRDGVLTAVLGGGLRFAVHGARVRTDASYLTELSEQLRRGFAVEGGIRELVDRGFRFTLGVEI